MKNGIVAIVFTLLFTISACHRSVEKTPDMQEIKHEQPIEKKEPDRGGLYYATISQSLRKTETVAHDLASACIKVSEAITDKMEATQPMLTPTEDISVIRPEKRLPLMQEKTAQVKNITAAIVRVAEMSKVEIAAPPGYVHTPFLTEELIASAKGIQAPPADNPVEDLDTIKPKPDESEKKK